MILTKRGGGTLVLTHRLEASKVHETEQGFTKLTVDGEEALVINSVDDVINGINDLPYLLDAPIPGDREVRINIKGGYLTVTCRSQVTGIEPSDEGGFTRVKFNGSWFDARGTVDIINGLLSALPARPELKVVTLQKVGGGTITVTDRGQVDSIKQVHPGAVDSHVMVGYCGLSVRVVGTVSDIRRALAALPGAPAARATPEPEPSLIGELIEGDRTMREEFDKFMIDWAAATAGAYGSIKDIQVATMPDNEGRVYLRPGDNRVFYYDDLGGEDGAYDFGMCPTPVLHLIATQLSYVVETFNARVAHAIKRSGDRTDSIATARLNLKGGE